MINQQKEDIEKKRKILSKRKPSSTGSSIFLFSLLSCILNKTSTYKSIYVSVFTLGKEKKKSSTDSDFAKPPLPSRYYFCLKFLTVVLDHTRPLLYAKVCRDIFSYVPAILLILYPEITIQTIYFMYVYSFYCQQFCVIYFTICFDLRMCIKVVCFNVLII